MRARVRKRRTGRRSSRCRARRVPPRWNPGLPGWMPSLASPKGIASTPRYQPGYANILCLGGRIGSHEGPGSTPGSSGMQASVPRPRAYELAGARQSIPDIMRIKSRDRSYQLRRPENRDAEGSDPTRRAWLRTPGRETSLPDGARCVGRGATVQWGPRATWRAARAGHSVTGAAAPHSSASAMVRVLQRHRSTANDGFARAAPLHRQTCAFEISPARASHDHPYANDRCRGVDIRGRGVRNRRGPTPVRAPRKGPPAIAPTRRALPPGPARATALDRRRDRAGAPRRRAVRPGR